MMGKSPLDMSQYKKIFGTCRIPGEKRDKLSFNDTKYVTVIHNYHVSMTNITIKTCQRFTWIYYEIIFLVFLIQANSKI